jgi:hypothetical protein
MAYKLDAGAGLFIAAFVLTLVGAVLLLVDPAPIVGERLVSFTSSLFRFTMLVTFIFGIAATVGHPVAWFEQVYGAKGDADYRTITYSLWSTRWSGAAPALSAVSTCYGFAKMWEATRTFAILTTVFAFVAVFVAFATAKLRVLLFLGLAVSIFALITWALAAKMFYARWCDGNIYMQGQMYTFNAGFALFVTGWVLSTVGAIGAAVANIAAPADSQACSERTASEQVNAEKVAA